MNWNCWKFDMISKNKDDSAQPVLGKLGKLTVVGAGPGDAELITLKGIKALETADVVLYDALIDTELLKYAHKAEHIYVG